MAIKLKAEKREDLKTSVTKSIRARGFIPSVIYGQDTEPTAISVEGIELLKTVRDEGRNAIMTLDIQDGESVDVMLHEYQTDPVSSDVTHIDFYIVNLTEAMDVSVVVNLVGEAVGSKEGGIVQQPSYELEVRAMPRDIPEEINVNIDELNIGDSISVSDLPVSDKYEFLDDQDATIVTVLPPEEEEEETEEVDLSVEPELVGAEDEEEEEEN
ncbi:MAG TPA: 50S ribosomal protein L25/general stress protein Ctc [Pseudogracilibacillus sp.]|nr:50S ribosomal protein L25/general stress protein Ctc [Pseudogracilibacillus sp.]